MSDNSLLEQQRHISEPDWSAAISARDARIRELEAQVSAYRRGLSSSPDARVSTLLSICAALLVTHDLEAILRLVVRESAALFVGSSGALLYMADETLQRLELRASSSGVSGHLSLAPGQGLAGKAFLTPRAMLMAGPEVEDALAELDADQVDELRKLLEIWPPATTLLAPLRLERQRIGALVLYGGTNAHMFHPRDLPFVQALADLAAVAIVETQLRQQTQDLQRDLSQTKTLHEQARAKLDSAQAQLLQSARLAAVGELSASVAHEINNPLYAARNSLYLIEQDLAPEAPQRAFLDIARDELGRIAKIITRMRDFYRPARDELGPTDLNALLEETLALVQVHLRHGSVTVKTFLDPALPHPNANADQIRQVMLNLMLNACDAMEGGGVLTVSTRALDDAQAVEVRIADTGVGISEALKAHLFEPFYTTKPQGTGLGLTISAHIVTQHGGTLRVESEEGKGATFIIQLPLIGPQE